MPRPRKTPVIGSGAQTTPDGVAALDRGIAILRSFETATPVLTLTELSLRTGLYKSTILRLVNSLLHAQLLERLPDGRYRLGPTTYQLGVAYRRSITAGDVLLPLMRALAEALGESVSFNVLSSETVRTCLLKVVSSRHVLRHDIQEGDQLPIDVGSGGRVLRAFSGTAGPRFDMIRRTYFYVSIGERSSDIAGIAAPVFGPDQVLAGALTVAGPLTRFTPAFIERAIPPILQAAARATHGLGGDPAPLERAYEGRNNPELK